MEGGREGRRKEGERERGREREREGGREGGRKELFIHTRYQAVEVAQAVARWSEVRVGLRYAVRVPRT